MATIKLTFDRAALVSAAEPWMHYSAPALIDESASDFPPASHLICGASSYPETIKYRPISNPRLYLYFHDNDSYRFYVSAFALLAPFDENTATYSDISFAEITPWELCYFQYTNPNAWNSKYVYQVSGKGYPNVHNALKFGFSIRIYSEHQFETPAGPNKPYIEFTYGPDNVGLEVTQTYPVGAATISKSIPTVFTWSAKPLSIATLEPVAGQSAELRWRYAGEAYVHSLPCETAEQCTVPANTFAEGTIEWQVAVTANSGIVTTSAWITTQVQEPVSSAAAVSPVSAMIDGSANQLFSWSHIISNGTSPSGFDLQVSRDQQTWEMILSQQTSRTSVVVQAGTLDAGDIWWRVRTYNLAGAPGSWSESAHCIVIAAPDTPVVTSDDASPRFAVRWQQSGQQAYELMVDGNVVSKRYTPESSYHHDGYLVPGNHSISVRIQNSYGLWSDWGTANILIVNMEGAPITLMATGENAVELSWTTSEPYSSYLVYRNGEIIAVTAETHCTDHFAVGPVKYLVRGIYAANGYYTLSNEAEVCITPKCLMIADVSAPDWIVLPLSTSSLREKSVNASQSVTYIHYVGASLPGAEIGEAMDKTFRLDCAWPIKNLTTARRFEALLGKVVCVKTPSCRRIIGVLAQMDSTENPFVISYSAPIVLVDWKEV